MGSVGYRVAEEAAGGWNQRDPTPSTATGPSLGRQEITRSQVSGRSQGAEPHPTPQETGPSWTCEFFSSGKQLHRSPLKAQIE